MKHPDNFSDFRPDGIPSQLGLLLLMLAVSQSNCPAQFWEAGVHDRFSYAESQVDRLE